MNNPPLCLPCDGIKAVTPLPIFNRPGLSALKYRIGSHSTFFESLLARISTLTAEELGDLSRTVNEQSHRRLTGQMELASEVEHPLRDLLTTREKTDPSIALLDAWSTLADVLTFYQERIANEGFLRTAQERRSIERLAHLTGYRLRPGVSSTVHLAFEVDDSAPEILIPVGTAAKSTPTPGSNAEPQTFETAKKLLSRSQWNQIKPRQTRPQRITRETVFTLEELFFNATGLRLNSNDYLAVVYNNTDPAVVHRIVDVKEEQERQRTRVILQKDALASSLLLEEVNRIVADFPQGIMPSSKTSFLPSITPIQVAPSREEVLTEIESIIQSHKPRMTLAELDADLHTFICEALASSASPAKEPRKRIAAFLEISRELFDHQIGGVDKGLKHLLNLDNFVFAGAKVLDTYRKNVATSIREFAAGDVRLIRLLALLATQPKLSAQTKLDLRELVLALTEVVCLGTRPTATVITGMGTIAGLGELEHVVSGSFTPIITKAEVTVLRTTVGLPVAPKLAATSLATFEQAATGGTLTITKAGTAMTTPTLADYVGALKLIESTNTNSRDLLVRVVDLDSNGDERTLAVAIQRTRIIGDPQLVELTTQEATSLVKISTEVPIRCALRSTVSNANYSVQFNVYRTIGNPGEIKAPQTIPVKDEDGNDVTLKLAKISDEQFTLKLDPAVAAIIPISSLNEALSQINFSASNNTGVVTTVFQVFNSQTMDTAHCVTSGLRDFIVYDPAASTDAVDSAGDIRPLVEAIQLTHMKANDATAAVDTWFPDNVWSTLIQQTSELLYGADPTFGTINGLLKAVNEKSICAGATEVDNTIMAIGNISGTDQEKWKARLRELVSDLRQGESNAVSPAVVSLLAASSTWLSMVLARPEISNDPTFNGLLDNIIPVVAALKASIALPNVAVSEASCAISIAHQEVESAGTLLVSRTRWLEESLTKLADNLTAALNRRRSLFLEKAIARVSSHDDRFGGATPDSVVKQWTDAFVTEARGLKAQLDLKMTAEFACNSCPATTCVSLAGLLQRLINLMDGVNTPPADRATNLREAKNVVSVDANREVSAMLDELDRLLAKVRIEKPSVDNPTAALPGLSDAIHLLLRQTGFQANGTLLQTFRDILSAGSDAIIQLARNLDETQRQFLYDMLRHYKVGTPIPEPRVYVFRSQANLFGWNAAARSNAVVAALKDKRVIDDNTEETDATTVLRQVFSEDFAELPVRMFLDGSFRNTTQESVVAVKPVNADEPEAYVVRSMSQHPHSAYGLKGNATELELEKDWWPTPIDASHDRVGDIDTIASARILCDAELLVLAEEPEDEVLPDSFAIECDELLEDLPTGKPILFEGTVDLGTGVGRQTYREFNEITDVDHNVDELLFGDRYKTTITLRHRPLRRFQRDSARIYANVVEATHGETQRETLGSGNAAAEFQKFLLKRVDVSQLVAPTVTGVKSALAVRVNDVEWEEKPDLKEAGRLAEQFVTRTDDAQQTVVVFGDGVNGARVPTGVENIRVEYRTGLGRKGNVGPGQISQLLGAPLGVKKVNNPLAARGGANPESRDDARSHVPLAVTAMDRLVSVQDFADFAMTYAGIGKASAALLQGTVHVTISGLEPESLGEDNPLYRNLQQAMSLFGDPSQQFELHDREASLLILIAKVKIDPKRQWELVQPKIRAALLQRFHYDRSGLGQDLLLSDTIATIQKVEGVLYVDVDKFDAVRQQDVAALATRLGSLQRRPRIRVNLARVTSENMELAELGLSLQDDEKMKAQAPSTGSATVGSNSNGQGSGNSTTGSRDVPLVRPAQLCYLTPDIPDTLILEAVR